jgi:hypothetical protein
MGEVHPLLKTNVGHEYFDFLRHELDEDAWNAHLVPLEEPLLKVSWAGNANWPSAANDQLFYQSREIKIVSRRTDKRMPI